MKFSFKGPHESLDTIFKKKSLETSGFDNILTTKLAFTPIFSYTLNNKTLDIDTIGGPNYEKEHTKFHTYRV